MKKKVQKSIASTGLPIIVAFLSVVGLGFLLFWRLDSLLPGWSQNELMTRSASQSFHQIFVTQPVDAPYHLAVYGLLQLLPHNVLAVRLVSVLYGVIAIGLFFWIVRCWHSPAAAWLASLMFATSTWFLRTSRLGTTDVLLFGLLVLMALGLWLQRTRHPRKILLLLIVVAALSLYVPGLIWFIGVTAWWQLSVMKDAAQRLPVWFMALAAVCVIVILAPLGLSVAQHWRFGLTILGLPQHVPNWRLAVQHLADVPMNLFARGPFRPGYWVGRTPVLDVLETILFFVGVYAYWQHRRLARFASLVSIFGITTVLVALRGPITLSLLMPFIYLVIATGLAFLLGEWLSVFPRNPIARGVGVGIVVVAVALSCFYQFNRYFFTWPELQQTKTTFSYHSPS